MKHLLRCLASFLLIFFSFNVWAAAPAIGTLIQNQASSSFVDTYTGYHAQLLSNTVRVRAVGSEALTLTQSQTLQTLAASPLYLLHTLTNTGNSSSSYTFQLLNVVGDQLDVSNLSLIYDANGNGVQDAGDTLLTATSSITLAAAQQASLIIRGMMPAALLTNQQAWVDLIATTTSGLSATNRDTLIVHNGALLSLTKSVDKQSAKGLDPLLYTLDLSNSGNADAQPIAVTVDGYAASYVLIRDVIPANGTFSKFVTIAGAGRGLYHVAGAALHTYTTQPPLNLASVDAIALGYPSMLAGSMLQLQFEVLVNSNASGTITNQGETYYVNPADTLGYITPSNAVVTAIPTAPIGIKYYTDGTYQTPQPSTVIGKPLYIQANASVCNTDPLVAEQRTVVVTSALTNDLENLQFTETGPNTGIFLLSQNPQGGVPTHNANQFPMTRFNAIIETLINDTLTASIQGCGVAAVQTNILIDPSGVVFDDVTNAPIQGAVVTLYTGTTPLTVANVWLDPTMTIVSPSTVVTDIYGAYQFPFVAPGTYNLAITPPAGSGYKPSILNPNLLPVGRTIVGTAGNPPTGPSYGTGSFPMTAATGAVVIDVPLGKSPQPTLGLFTRKTVSTNTVGMGEVVYYTVDVNNTSLLAVNSVSMKDQLPHGFSYVAGTAKRDGVKIADPTLGAGGVSLTIPLGTINAATTTTLTYAVRVGVGSLQGTGINYAWSETPLQKSNVAQAQVTVLPSMLGDQGYITGKVYLDCDHNRMQGMEEVGVPGVRLYMEDGTFVITDVEGKWNMSGVSPRTHVIKVDPITLPHGAQLMNLSNRHAGDPSSQFVDLKKGSLHRADFAIGNCTQPIRAEVFERRDRGEVVVSEVQRSMTVQTPSTAMPIPNAGSYSPVAQGILDARLPVQGIEPQMVTQTLHDENSNLPNDPLRAVMQLPLDQRITLMNNQFGFVDLHEGDRLPYRQSNVVVKGVMGSDFQLMLNGSPVSDKKVGEKSSLPSKNIEVWKYIALDLKEGDNTLRVLVKDGFGNIRGDETVHVMAPGDAAQLKITMPESGDADGQSLVTVLVELQDQAGLPVTVRTPLTLESSLGRWLVKDVDEREQGVQSYIEGGRAEFKLLPPQLAGETKVRVTTGLMSSTAQMDFLPPLRPMMAVGVLEGQIQVNSFDMRQVRAVRQRDNFEQALTLFARSTGKTDAGTRAAVFLKGRVLGSYLLTASYDSDKPTQSLLFRDIQPNIYYPIYGDSSVKGFDAQSTQRMYVRLDHGRSWLLYGDFTTQADGEDVRRLSQYNRTLTGVRHHYEDKVVRVDAFASQGVSRQLVQEVAANGTSGPYYLTNPNMLLNSEKVELLVRDRNQSSIILQTQTLQRFADYQVDGVSGRIILAKPMASFDANLNPQSMRVTYEVDQGGKAFWTMGANGDVKINEHLLVGGTYVKDRDPLNPSQLSAAHTQLKITEMITATAEIARSTSALSGSGLARWAEVRGQQGVVDGRIYAGNSDVGFNNPSALLNQGREEVGAEATAKISESTSVNGKVLQTRDKNLGSQRRGTELSLSQTLNQWAHAEVGYRHSIDSSGAGAVAGALAEPLQSRSLRLKLASQIPGLESVGVSGEYERDIQQSGKRRVALGADYQMDNQGKLYARHELISSNSGAFGLNGAQTGVTTVLGMDTAYMKDGTLFSEYRARDAISGRENQAVLGLRNGWHVAEGWGLSTNVERLTVLNGPGNSNSTTLGAGLAYTADPLLKATGRLEFHFGTAEDSTLATLGVAKKLDLDWSLLGQNTYSKRLTKTSQAIVLDDLLQLGLAYRQTDENEISGLGMYEFGYKRDDALVMRRQSHLLSTHVNVQPIRPLTLSGRLGSKWIREHAAGMNFNYGLQAVGARAMYDITERWDAGVLGSTLFSSGWMTQQYGLGVETGYLVEANLWISVGYNMFGYKDREMVLNQYTDQGVYLRLRYKFDEHVLESLNQ